MLTRTLILSAIVSFGVAQVPSISSSCQATLAAIATSPDVNACLAPSPLLSALMSTSASIVDPINNWLTGLCAAPACSSATLAAIVTNATSGCSAEFGAFGVSGSEIPAITTLVQQYYPTVRKSVCLKDGNTNCVTQTLTNIQNIVGPLTISNITTLFSDSDIAELPNNVTCTNCVKALYNTINTDVPGVINPEALQGTCGNSFIDGTNPAGITQSASDATQSNTTSKDSNGATQLSFGALSGVSILAAIVLLV